MSKYIELVNLTKYHIIFLLVPLFYVSVHYLHKKQNKIYKRYKDIWEDCHENSSGKYKCLELHEFAFFFNIFFPKLLSIFPYLIFGSEKNNNLVSAQTIKIRNNNINVTQNTKKAIMIILLIIICMLEIFYRIESFSKNEKTKNFIDIKLGNIFLLPIFSFFIINDKIHRHHIFSFILSFLGIVFICVFLNSIYQNRDYYKGEIRYFGEQMKHLSFSIFSSLALILSKLLFYNLNSTFFYLFYDGIICITLSLFFALLEIDHFGEDLIDILVLFSTVKLNFLFFGITFLSFGYYLSSSLIIYHFSPNHLMISEALCLFLRWIIEMLFENKIENEDKSIIIIKIIGFLIIFISSLIYNEYLILHFFDCDNIQYIMDNDKLI